MSEAEHEFDALPEATSDDGSSEFVQLNQPGDEIVGELAYREIEAGQDGNSTILCFRTGENQYRKYWASGQVLGALTRAGAELGDVVGVRVTDETDSFEADDGEEVEYNLIDTRVDKSHRED